MNKPELLHLDALYEMADGDVDFLNKVAGEFEMVARETLVKLNEGLTSNDFSTIRSAVHRIKPNFSYLGMEKQAELASVIIMKIDHDRDKKEVIQLVGDIILDINKALREVDDVKSKWN